MYKTDYLLAKKNINKMDSICKTKKNLADKNVFHASQSQTHFL